jgi:hypothetical protein
MANANTIDRLLGAGTPAQGVKAAPTVTLVATTEKLVLDQTGATATVSVQPAGSFPTLGSQDLFKFVVRATFKTTTGGTSTSVVNIYKGTSVVSGNKVCSITSASLATASASGFLEAHLIWDSTTLVLSGYQLAAYGAATPIAATALTNTAIAVANQQALQFCITATNGSSVVGTTFTLGEFVVETA